MKKLFLTSVVLFIIGINSFAFAKTADSKNFPVNADNMYMISLTALNKLNYGIKELQSSSGYILFTANNGNEYLLAVTSLGEEASNVKITKLKQSSQLTENQKSVYVEITKNIENITKKENRKEEKST